MIEESNYFGVYFYYLVHYLSWLLIKHQSTSMISFTRVDEFFSPVCVMLKLQLLNFTNLQIKLWFGRVQVVCM